MTTIMYHTNKRCYLGWLLDWLNYYQLLPLPARFIHNYLIDVEAFDLLTFNLRSYKYTVDPRGRLLQGTRSLILSLMWCHTSPVTIHSSYILPYSTVRITAILDGIYTSSHLWNNLSLKSDTSTQYLASGFKPPRHVNHWCMCRSYHASCASRFLHCVCVC